MHNDPNPKLFLHLLGCPLRSLLRSLPRSLLCTSHDCYFYRIHASLFLFHLINFIPLVLSLSQTRLFTYLCCSIWSSDCSLHHYQHCCHQFYQHCCQQFSHLEKEIGGEKWEYKFEGLFIWDLVQFSGWYIFDGLKVWEQFYIFHNKITKKSMFDNYKTILYFIF